MLPASSAEMETEAGANMASTSYEQLGRRHPEVASVDSSHLPEHDNDRKNIVYYTLVTAGIGFVLPYNRWESCSILFPIITY